MPPPMLSDSSHPTATAGQIALPRTPEAGARARRFVETCFGPRLGPLALDNARLVATELITNAFLHGEGDITLRASLRGDVFRLEVVDEGTGNAPAIREQPEGDGGGWGLRIVDTLALRWGAFEGTTHVWADLAAA